MIEMISEQIKKLIETPPSKLSESQKIQIKFNSFVRKNYYIRWKIKEDKETNINYAFDRGGVIMN